MASTMQFSPGDIIQEFEEPLVKYLDEKYRGQHCHSCFLSNPMLRKCTGCKMAFYCNELCQNADWRNCHSIECALFSIPNVLSSVKGDWIFRVIKLLAYRKKNGVRAKKRYSLYDGTTRCFDDLQGHYCDNDNSQTIKNSFRTLAVTLTDTKLFTLAESSYKNLMHLYGIWRTKRFDLNNQENTENIGAAVYISASAFDHSCRPNAWYVMDASYRLQVRCIDDIPFGETPKISYLFGVHPRNVRRGILYCRFYFTCDCVFCQMERDAPMVDYDVLKRRLTKLQKKTSYTVDDFQCAMDLIQELQKIFCQYDERITVQFYLILHRLDFTLLQSSGHVVKEFVEQAEKNLRITYGTNDRIYKHFIEHQEPYIRRMIQG